MRVATWNVLHGIHARNWNEADVLERFPDETSRIAAITRRIADFLTGGERACICLQEVSGDQLASLREALPSWAISSLRHPRLPRLKRPGPAPLADATEHLVTISPEARVLAAESFPNDPGKGCLVVSTREMTILNTHVSFGNSRIAQLDQIAALADRDGFVLCGDFNHPEAEVLEALGSAFSASDPFPGTRGERRSAIDHILLRGLCGTESREMGVDFESDHLLVSVRIDCDRT